MSVIDYIRSDLFRYTGRPSAWLFLPYYFGNRSFKYSCWLRLCSSSNALVRVVARVMHFRLSRKYGIHIPVSVKIGYGLYIGHGMCLVMHPTTRIGNNCNFSQFSTIGSCRGKAAVIGDEVYIGPGTCVVEDVSIGSGATIGAGAVVVKDVPKHTTVAGVPATSISVNQPGRNIQNPWPVCRGEECMREAPVPAQRVHDVRRTAGTSPCV